MSRIDNQPKAGNTQEGRLCEVTRGQANPGRKSGHVSDRNDRTIGITITTITTITLTTQCYIVHQPLRHFIEFSFFRSQLKYMICSYRHYFSQSFSDTLPHQDPTLGLSSWQSGS
jgi:hypothetical protein